MVMHQHEAGYVAAAPEKAGLIVECRVSAIDAAAHVDVGKIASVEVPTDGATGDAEIGVGVKFHIAKPVDRNNTPDKKPLGSFWC